MYNSGTYSITISRIEVEILAAIKVLEKLKLFVISFNEFTLKQIVEPLYILL